MSRFEDQIKNDYFEWLYKNACKGKINDNVSYRKVFHLMHNTNFDFYMPNDVNRANDGIDLRYRFGNRHGYDNIMNIIDEPCSVLEMMLALAMRCEDTIMANVAYGDRTTQWFWGMMQSLGLSYMIDERYDQNEANRILYDFMEHRYQPNGKGGLFYIRDCANDLRDEEIWTQLCWYLEKFE